MKRAHICVGVFFGATRRSLSHVSFGSCLRKRRCVTSNSLRTQNRREYFVIGGLAMKKKVNGWYCAKLGRKLHGRRRKQTSRSTSTSTMGQHQQQQFTIGHAFRFIAYDDKREHAEVSFNFHFICEMKDKRQG